MKHKRRIRKSQTTGQQLDIPNPSKKEKALWKTLVAACVAACLATDRTDNVNKKQKVRIVFPDYSKRPKGFPTGRIVERLGKRHVVDYSCDLLLLWLYEHKLADYSPTMLYRAKSGLLTEYENQLDISALIDL